jgi:hypothetical protein
MRLLQGRVNPAANYVSGLSRVCLLYLLGLEHVDNLGASRVPCDRPSHLMWFTSTIPEPVVGVRIILQKLPLARHLQAPSLAICYERLITSAVLGATV